MHTAFMSSLMEYFLNDNVRGTFVKSKESSSERLLHTSSNLALRCYHALELKACCPGYFGNIIICFVVIGSSTARRFCIYCQQAELSPMLADGHENNGLDSAAYV